MEEPNRRDETSLICEACKSRLINKDSVRSSDQSVVRQRAPVVEISASGVRSNPSSIQSNDESPGVPQMVCFSFCVWSWNGEKGGGARFIGPMSR